MSTFAVKPVRIEIEPHTNADALELAKVGDYRCVVKKGQYHTGSLVFYIPEAAVVPEDILKAYGFWNTEKNMGMLAGTLGNRVKAIKLRGELSQGIVLPIDSGKDCGGPFFNLPTDDGIGTLMAINDFNKDYATELGITKWEPPIPTAMAGEVYNAGTDFTVNYDIENIKAWPDAFKKGDRVRVTEKLHGTFCQVTFIPASMVKEGDEHYRVETDVGVGYITVASKGLGARGLCFKDNEANANNVYLRATRPYWQQIVRHYIDVNIGHPVVICGEVFGDGIQDLHYGMSGTFGFRAFDIFFKHSRPTYLDTVFFDSSVKALRLESVPVLFDGAFDNDMIKSFAQHTKSVFDDKQIREGVVIRSWHERFIPELGRLVLKSINEDYLLRKGNATEFN